MAVDIIGCNQVQALTTTFTGHIFKITDIVDTKVSIGSSMVVANYA
jgi:hypothetical protein